MDDMDSKFTSYLNVLLPHQDDSTSLCFPEDLFAIRTTLYILLKKNKFEVLYGADFEQGFIPFRTKENQNVEALRLSCFEKWKSQFFDVKLLNESSRDCPQEFHLAEDFLSIVARGYRDQEIRFLILFAKSGAVKKEEIPSYKTYIKENKYDRCWVIADECTSQSKNFMQRIGEETKSESVQMRFVPCAKLKSNWTENMYVHKYHVVTKKEQAKRKLKEKEIEQYPKVLISDSACIQTLADVGDILESTGPSVTAGKISQYKLVIPR